MLKIIKQRAILFVCGALLGWVCHYLHLPIPFMLGGIIVGASARFSFAPDAHWPLRWRNMGLAVAGYGIGRNFTLATVFAAKEQLLGIALAAICSVALSIILSYWIYRTSKASLITCVLAMMPGGLNQMILLSEEYPRSDPNAVVVGQTLRLCCVVFIVPILVTRFLGATPVHQSAAIETAAGAVSWLFLIPLGIIGYYAARRLSIPTPMLLGPIFAAAIASLMAGVPLEKVPFAIMSIAQLNIGLYIGGMLDQKRLMECVHLIAHFLLFSLFLVASGIAVAEILSRIYDFSVITAFLAMAPGGVAEMCLVALSIDADIAIVLVYQLARMLTINLIVPFGIKYYFGKPSKN